MRSPRQGAWLPSNRRNQRHAGEPGMPNSVLFGLQSCGYPSDKLQLTSVDLNGEAGLAPRVNRKGMHGREPRAADVIFQPRCLTCMHAQIMRQS